VAPSDSERHPERDEDIFRALARTIPAPPALLWSRWRAELGEKLAKRRRPAWWRRPVPLAVSAGLAAALVVVAVWMERETGPNTADLVGLEEVALGGRLSLLQEYGVVERLDLLEELDVIRNLERLAAGREG